SNTIRKTLHPAWRYVHLGRTNLFVWNLRIMVLVSICYSTRKRFFSHTSVFISTCPEKVLDYIPVRLKLKIWAEKLKSIAVRIWARVLPYTCPTSNRTRIQWRKIVCLALLSKYRYDYPVCQ